MELVPILSNLIKMPWVFYQSILARYCLFSINYLDIYGTLKLILLDLSVNNSAFKFNGNLLLP